MEPQKGIDIADFPTIFQSLTSGRRTGTLKVSTDTGILFFYFSGDGAGHIQSLLLGATFIILGFITFLIALVADLIGFNRQLLEQTLEKVRRLELAANRKDSTHE